VAVNGLPYFCRKLSNLVDGDGWSVPYRSPFHPAGLAARFVDLARCDLAYSWTGKISMGKFLRAARALKKEKIVLLWCGSDVLFAKEELRRGKMDPWVSNLVHWAVSPCLAEEVRSLGIACEYVQASFVQPVQPSPLPEEFSVLVYAPSVKREQLYGLDHVLEVANQLPRIRFRLVGLRERHLPGCPTNLEVHGHVDMDRFYREATVIWRPVRHDAGISFMVLEALAHGRHILYSYPFPGCVHVAEVGPACKEIERLRDLHASQTLNLNENGRQVVAQDFSPQVVRSRLLQRWKEIILGPDRAPSSSRVYLPSATS
jgi:glycosyltransferase involved in cell wall biosynthesis